MCYSVHGILLMLAGVWERLLGELWGITSLYDIHFIYTSTDIAVLFWGNLTFLTRHWTFSLGTASMLLALLLILHDIIRHEIGVTGHFCLGWINLTGFLVSVCLRLEASQKLLLQFNVHVCLNHAHVFSFFFSFCPDKIWAHSSRNWIPFDHEIARWSLILPSCLFVLLPKFMLVWVM